MNPHFFTAPFYFAFIWFKVQGSGFRWRLRRKYTYDDTRSPLICRTLLRFPHLSFIPPVPYPPLRGTFP